MVTQSYVVSFALGKLVYLLNDAGRMLNDSTLPYIKQLRQF